MVGMSVQGDPMWVITGSFNFTEGATKHLENCLVISNPEVAQFYLDEFVNLYKISKPLKI
jgi:phosphatidylserine/phosphatidylglycerophosphate/cardiolipin synthase-like enzyme